MNVFGSGALKGMMVTLKNFATSYFMKPDNGGIFTVQYPEELCKISENSRNFPFLVYDAEAGSPRCTACMICERECPTKCIHIEMAKDEAVPIPINFGAAEIGAVPTTLDQNKIKVGTGKPLRKPAVFDLDYGLCMNCGMCEEVCPFDSIFMDRAYEISGADRLKDLSMNKEALLKPNSYFQKIRPYDAGIIDAKRKAAEEKKKAPPPSAGGQALPPPAPPIPQEPKP